MSKDAIELKYYRRMWIFVTVTTVLGLGLTTVLNVMHAPPSLGGRIVGGCPPVFVLFCLELISRIPATSKLRSGFRVAASILVTGISFAISYEQQREFVMELGFAGWIAYAFPVIIDGVMVVSTLSLVEVTVKVRELRAAALTQDAPAGRPVVVTPAEQTAEERGRAFREAAAKLRTESTMAALNGKPIFVEPLAEVAA